MRRLIGTVTMVTLVLGAGTSALAQARFTTRQDAAAGAQVMHDKGCLTCHAINGKGGKVGPDLARTTRPRTFFDLAASLWNHAPQMAARMRQLGIQRPRLTARETGDLAGYLFTLNYFDPPGEPAQGRRLFTEKRCVACHRIGGTGGTEGPKLDSFKIYASPIGLAAAMWNHGPRMMAVMETKGIERPTFKGTELVDLIAYINQSSPTAPTGPLYVLPGRPSDGRRHFVGKLCATCHTVATGGGEGTVDLAEREAHKSLTEFAAAMWNKAPRMVEAMKARSIPVPSLRPEEMADIVAYLYSVRYFAEAGDPRKGVILATYRGCLRCHGLYGERGKPASDLARAQGLATPAGSLAALWNHSFIADPAKARDRTPWPTFTGPEMADLIAYLRSVSKR